MTRQSRWERLQAEMAMACGDERDRLARLQNQLFDEEEQEDWDAVESKK